MARETSDPRGEAEREPVEETLEHVIVSALQAGAHSVRVQASLLATLVPPNARVQLRAQSIDARAARLRNALDCCNAR